MGVSSPVADSLQVSMVHAISPVLSRNASLHPQLMSQKNILSKDQKFRSDWAQKKSKDSQWKLQSGIYKLFEIRKLSSSTVFCRVQDGATSDWESEEARWLREEKRWLREEERWLREEARWGSERKDLIEQALASRVEIEALKYEVTQLQSQVRDEKGKDEALSNLIVSLTNLLQSLNIASLATEPQSLSAGQGQIPSSASTFTEISKSLGQISSEIPSESIEMVAAISQPSILELDVPITFSGGSKTKKRALKRGAEGEDVKTMQEALSKLGFYSGDDDMEYSTFSSGTERAVRSWQASIGAFEDGVVTAELLQKMLEEESLKKKKIPNSLSQVNATPKASSSTSNAGAKGPASAVQTIGSANTSTSPSVAGARATTSDVNLRTSAGNDAGKLTGTKVDSGSSKKLGNIGLEAPQRRVYLLGENRWEEPDRLLSKNGPTTTAAASKALGEQCFSCKGQGSMLCTECDGTGELNVEEQFLEWAEEGAKCPYCEGKGVVDCDVCAGKGVRALT